MAANGVVDVVVDDEAQAVAVTKRLLGYFQGRIEPGAAADGDDVHLGMGDAEAVLGDDVGELAAVPGAVDERGDDGAAEAPEAVEHHGDAGGHQQGDPQPARQELQRQRRDEAADLLRERGVAVGEDDRHRDADAGEHRPGEDEQHPPFDRHARPQPGSPCAQGSHSGVGKRLDRGRRRAAAGGNRPSIAPAFRAAARAGRAGAGPRPRRGVAGFGGTGRRRRALQDRNDRGRMARGGIRRNGKESEAWTRIASTDGRGWRWPGCRGGAWRRRRPPRLRRSRRAGPARR